MGSILPLRRGTTVRFSILPASCSLQPEWRKVLSMLDAIARDGGRAFSLSPAFTETGPTVLSVRLARW